MTFAQEKNLQGYHDQFSQGHDAYRSRLMAELSGIRLEPRRSSLRRWWLPGTLSTAAAIGLVLILASVFSPGAATVSWADVARQLENIHTFSCRWTMTESDGKISETHQTVDYFRAPDQNRVDEYSRFTPPPTTNPQNPIDDTFIMNGDGHPNTELQIAGRGMGVQQRVCFSPAPGLPVTTVSWYTRLRDIAKVGQAAGKGEEMIDGRRLIRFEDRSGYGLGLDNGVLTVWVDPKTSLPVRALVTGQHDGKQYTVKSEDMRFDPPLPDSLFVWPSTDHTVQWESLTIYVPSGTRFDACKLNMTTRDDTFSVTSADLITPRMAKSCRLFCRLTDEAGLQLEKFMSARIGQTMKIQMDASATQEILIAGPIKNIDFISPVVSNASTATAPVKSSTQNSGR